MGIIRQGLRGRSRCARPAGGRLGSDGCSQPPRARAKEGLQEGDTNQACVGHLARGSAHDARARPAGPHANIRAGTLLDVAAPERHRASGPPRSLGTAGAAADDRRDAGEAGRLGDLEDREQRALEQRVGAGGRRLVRRFHGRGQRGRGRGAARAAGGDGPRARLRRRGGAGLVVRRPAPVGGSRDGGGGRDARQAQAARPRVGPAVGPVDGAELRGVARGAGRRAAGRGAPRRLAAARGGGQRRRRRAGGSARPGLLCLRRGRGRYGGGGDWR